MINIRFYSKFPPSHASANSTAFRLFGGKKSKSNKITCGPAQKLEYVITHVPVWKTKCKIVEDKVCEEPKRKGRKFNELELDGFRFSELSVFLL